MNSSFKKGILLKGKKKSLIITQLHKTGGSQFKECVELSTYLISICNSLNTRKTSTILSTNIHWK